MWYENSYRRHLCDMHIDDWDDSFLSALSPEVYVENLKKANIQSAMIYLQSHVGLCYYPTKSGKMHEGFKGSEDAMRRLIHLCREAGIHTIGYYSLIYNTWAHDQFPAWRLVGSNGMSTRMENGTDDNMEFSDKSRAARYGHCCPNNTEYRNFIETQIHEMAEYFTVDGMFYDMLFWPRICYCDCCKARWKTEVGGDIPIVEDWQDSRWLLHMHKRREWIGEFARWVTDLTKELMPGVSVEHNVAYSVLPNGMTANCEEVISACDYAGGDLYRNLYSHSFACKFYRSVTKHQPFEYMFSRCAPNLSMHTQIKSKDSMRSAVSLTMAHHGATLVIDAIDPAGTMDNLVYERLGEVFSELIPYEAYMDGTPIEDVGLYYSLKSKFSPRNDHATNYTGVTIATETLVTSHILCGVSGSFQSLEQYKILIAPLLTSEDTYDNERLINYVKNGGTLYFSGGDNPALLKTFFGAEVTGRTKEKVIYTAPEDTVSHCFDYFTKARPLHFETTAPIVSGITKETVLATLTMPYTHQNTTLFASIHSNPPGIRTEYPALAMTSYGKGTVLWSGLSIESEEFYDYRRIFVSLLKELLGLSPTVSSDAPKDVEITAFETETGVLLHTVLLCEDYSARKTEDFHVSVTCKSKPKKVLLLPKESTVPCEISGNTVSFLCENPGIFRTFCIQTEENSTCAK